MAHTGTDIYGPGYVLEEQGQLRRVRFVKYVATVSVYDLRTANEEETRRVKAWKRDMVRRYGRGWTLGEDDATRSRMTIRVSRDSGRTYGPVIVVSPRKDVPPQNDSSRLPDCTCPRCVAP